MESGPMGMRQNRSHEGFSSLNIRTDLSSWIHYWMQHSYILQLTLISSLTMSAITPSPTCFCDGDPATAFSDSIWWFDTSKKPEGYWGPSEVGWKGCR